MTGPDRPGPVAVVAGSGPLPLSVFESLKRRGRDTRILALRGFADPAVRRRADAAVDLFDVGRALDILARWAPSAVMLVGGVQRPTASAVLGAFSAFRNRNELLDLLARGDDHLLRGVLGLLEEQGHRVLGVQDLTPELLAREGIQGARTPTDAGARAASIGFDVLARLSPFDIGQAAVVAGERVLAIEGPEGTDRMLARVRPRLLPRLVSRRRGRTGVLVKAPKKGQDLRVDLPAIGPRTIGNAAKAGLEGVAVRASSTLILEQAEAVAMADRLGIFLVAVAEERAGSA